MTGREVFAQVLSELSGHPISAIRDIADALLAELPISQGHLDDELSLEQEQALLTLLRQEKAALLGLPPNDDESTVGHA
jgi:hypothetical protein